METRANYVLIGLFTLLGFVGILGFFLWFAKVQLDQQFAYYDVKFTSISGLARASDVRFAGLPVGQVVDVRLSPDKDGTVLVRLEIDADVPVRADSKATIESQGVTGVSYVGISAGDVSAPLLRSEDPSKIPLIPAGRSVLQTITEDAPRLVDEAVKVMNEVANIVSAENAARINNILANAESASEDFKQTLEDFSVVSSAVSGFAIEISNFNAMLKDVTGKADLLVDSTNTTIQTINQLAEDSRKTVAAGTTALEQATTTMASADGFIRTDLQETTVSLRAGIEDLRTQVQSLGADARTMLSNFSETGTLANARLSELETTIQATDTMIAELNRTLSSVDQAATSFEHLVSGDATALIAETRAAIAPIAAASQNDLPQLMADIRSATATATQTVQEVGHSLSTAAGNTEALIADARTTMATVTETFSRANGTLEQVNQALSIGSRTMLAAERAFEGADRVINDDIATITGDLRKTIAGLDQAIAQVSNDIPAISADLKAASQAAKDAFATVESTMKSASGPVRDFAIAALPQYTALARETRDLVNHLDQLTRQIQRDPARFFFGSSTPDFRR